MVCWKPKRPERRFFVILGPEMWRPKGRHKFLTVQGGATAPLAPPPWIRPCDRDIRLPLCSIRLNILNWIVWTRIRDWREQGMDLVQILVVLVLDIMAPINKSFCETNLLRYFHEFKGFLLNFSLNLLVSHGPVVCIGHNVELVRRSDTQDLIIDNFRLYPPWQKSNEVNCSKTIVLEVILQFTIVLLVTIVLLPYT